ncbi:MAG: alpha/beta fold hydrolase, partial [Myxococcales bacterium]|nr:alpha/beta fold hydrolase [Myxococcales bacterium]
FDDALAVEAWVQGHAPRLEVFGERPRKGARPPVYGSSQLFDKLQALMREKGRDTLIYVHGYNTTFGEALATAYGLQWHLRTRGPQGMRPCNVVLFSWPSDGKMTPFTAYRSDRDDAELTGRALGRMLLRIGSLLQEVATDDACDGRVHLMCHSMGNHVLEHAMRAVHDNLPGRLPRIFHEVLLMASDVDADALQEVSKLALVANLARRVTVYHNRRDAALATSDLTKGNPDRLGHAGPANMALLPAKVDVVDCTAVRHPFPHHGYHLATEVLADVAVTLGGEPRGPAGWNPAHGRWVL